MSVSCFSNRIPAHKPCFIRTWQAATRAHCFSVTRNRNKNPSPRVLSVTGRGYTGCLFTAAFWDLRLKPGKPGFPAFGERGKAGPELGGGPRPLAGVTEQHAERPIPARRPRGERSGNLSSSLAGTRTSLSDITGRGQRRRLRLTKCNCLLGSPSGGFSAEHVIQACELPICTQECSVSFTWRTAWQQRQLWLIQVPHQRQPEHLSWAHLWSTTDAQSALWILEMIFHWWNEQFSRCVDWLEILPQ